MVHASVRTSDIRIHFARILTTVTPPITIGAIARATATDQTRYRSGLTSPFCTRMININFSYSTDHDLRLRARSVASRAAGSRAPAPRELRSSMHMHARAAVRAELELKLKGTPHVKRSGGEGRGATIARELRRRGPGRRRHDQTLTRSNAGIICMIVRS